MALTVWYGEYKIQIQSIEGFPRGSWFSIFQIFRGPECINADTVDFLAINAADAERFAIKRAEAYIDELKGG